MKRPPEPTSADLRAWKRLTREAGKAAATPAAPVGDLSAAEKAARKAVAIGVLTRTHPCLLLVHQSRAFCQTAPADRSDLAPGLAQLVDAVDALIVTASAPKDPPPRPRYRADVDG